MYGNVMLPRMERTLPPLLFLPCEKVMVWWC